MNEKIKSKLYFVYNALKSNIGDIFAAALTSYILASIVNIFCSHKKTVNLNFIESVNIPLTFEVFAGLTVVFLLLLGIGKIGSRILYTAMLASVIAFAFIVVSENNNDIYITVGVAAVVCFFCYYIIKSGCLFKNKIITTYRRAFAVVALAFVIMAWWVSRMTVNRYVTFGASNFDFGIFAQLFENMARNGSTVISVERNEMMSHFYNHFSPIYYVLLPLYMLFRRPEGLLIIQAVFVLASAFPLCLIGKKRGFTPVMVMLLGLIAMTLPGMVSPMFYDFHENKFLPFFMLWFIYFFIDKKYVPAYIFMFLTLMIKEDAAIYVVCVLLYFMIVKKRVKAGFLGIALTILYAVPVMIFMRKYGLDFVGWRFGLYFLDGQDKIINMVQNIMLNPAFFIKNVFSEDCVIFMIYMLGALVFVPLATKDFRALILLVPLVAINVMTDYPYQHDIGFQYTYGSLTLMLILFVDNISNMKADWKKTVLLCALCTSVLLTLNDRYDDFETYNKSYTQCRDKYEKTEEALARIPMDASITADTFIVPHLYKHQELYMYDEECRNTDYYVLDSGNGEQVKEFEENMEYEDYELCLNDSKVRIYKLPEAEDLLPVSEK